ncbi:MAG: hypothetical protein WDO18_03275 [Acidobacteriota bacterium]
MSRHFSNEELRGFDRKLADPQHVLRIDRHLADCAECAGRLRSLGPAPKLPEVTGEFAGSLHPAYEDLTGYIDGMLESDAGEQVKYHLLVCKSCAAEVRDLRALEHHMTAPVLAEEAEPVTPSKHGWMEWFHAVRLRPGFAVASAALVVLGLGLITRAGLMRPEEIASQTILGETPSMPTGTGVELYIGIAILVAGLAGLLYRSRK